MRRMRPQRSRARFGLPPGSLVYTGEPQVAEPRVECFTYTAEEYTTDTGIARLFEKPHRNKGVTWINIDGLHDVEMLERLGEHYRIHPLVLEDILSTTQRPKIEYYDEYLFITLKMLYQEPADRQDADSTGEIISEQVSLILGNGFVLSFQERPGDTFDPIRKRIQNDKGRIRKMGPDYLAYSLIDSIVDNYFVLLEDFGDRLVLLEDGIDNNADSETARRIHAMKRELIGLRRAVWPLRELVGTMHREGDRFSAATIAFLRDLYDHAVQVIDTVESYRDMVSGLMDLYVSTVSNRMNEVMKVLTIIATIFIPLTFIAGIYGMNFDTRFPFNLPELSWRYGYFFALGLMVIVAVGMIIYFKRKKWL